MRVELISITKPAGKMVKYCETAEDIIVYVARVSNPKNQLNFKTGAKLIKHCENEGHVSIFESASFTVEIETSRGLSPQLLRHWSFRFQEYSQRYSAVSNEGIEIYAARRQDKANKQNSIDDLPDYIKKEWENRQLENWQKSFEHYKWALDNDIAKECARFVLPLGVKTSLYMTGNIRSWIHFILSRTAAGTQKEHRDIANECKKIMVENFPVIGEAFNFIDNQSADIFTSTK